MATLQNGKPEALRIIESISKFVGVLVGTVVVTGKQIIGLVMSSGEGVSGKPVGKTKRAPAKRKKKTAGKTETKVPKAKKKKKKVVKPKGTGSSGKSGASKKKATQSPVKKKKITTPKKKTTRHKTKKTVKNEGASHSEDGLISETGAGT